MMKQKGPFPTGFFLWRMASEAARHWQKRQRLVGMDGAYIYPLGKPVYLQTLGM